MPRRFCDSISRSASQTHGIGLYGIHNFYEMTGDEDALKTMVDWFEAR